MDYSLYWKTDGQGSYHLEILTNGNDLIERLLRDGCVARQGDLKETADPARELVNVYALDARGGIDDFLQMALDVELERGEEKREGDLLAGSTSLL